MNRINARTITAIGRMMGSQTSFRLLRLRSFPPRLPLRLQCRAVDFLSPEVHPVDLPRVGDALERIRVEHNEIGVLASRHFAGIELCDGSRVACRRGDHL